MTGELLDLIADLINATPICPVLVLWNLTGRLLQLGQFLELDVPEDLDMVVLPSDPINQHRLLLSASKSNRRISV